MAILFTGCSKKTSPRPIVTFRGYGANGATFSLSNPGKDTIICRLQIQPAYPGSSDDIIMLHAGASSGETMSVRQTNGVSLLVTIVKATPVEKFTVPMQ